MNSLLLTAHDYRTPRRANMHFIADELAKRGTTRFFSLRYSRLSKHKGDARVFIDDRTNRVETVDGVDCYLWKAVVHPFNTHRSWLRPLEDAMFRHAARHPPPVLIRWMKEADVIFFESGSAIQHVWMAERVNPSARRVYIASDDLAVIDVAPFIHDEFARVAPAMHALCLTSPRLADDMPRTANRYVVPHGLDLGIADRADPSPYDARCNAVSVGSMLFDRSFFEIAGAAFPDIVFHVIGPGAVDRHGFPPNVRIHDEMPHEETLRYIKHAQFGIAPYIADSIPAYLADTSMKLMQYRLFNVPAVCPGVVAGAATDRFGYEPRHAESIRHAITRALSSKPRHDRHDMLSWSEVTDRLIDPSAFADTSLDFEPTMRRDE